MWDGILNGCAAALYELAKLVGDWGLAIIIVTLIIRLLLFPIQRKQLKSSFQMQQVQPRMQEIQKLYAGDQVKIQQEMQKLYQETGFNPLAGCLTMLIQMPIFIILFQVLRDKIGQYAGGELSVSFYNILPNLTQTVPDAFNQDIVYSIPYIIMMVLFIGLSVTPMILQMKQNPQNRSQMTMMMGIMGIMFTWMAFISPAGVMLYWALSSGFALVQQLITQRVLKKEAAEKEEAAPVKPIKVNVERREKKKRPTKKH
ncbi:MAG TPA: YidC/Oxa1 family membrane protein insertase [Coriobacteriaceae bacterium]|nr:YidC/Oxa1 family membrane protein insertase [Coriobacteriaceae bacterium]